RARQFGGGREIHQPELLADRLVRQCLEIETRWLAGPAHFLVGRLVGAVRHFRRRQVRQPGQEIVDLLAQLRRIRRGGGLLVLVAVDLLDQLLGALAAFLRRADLARQPVARCLRLLALGFQPPPFAVERQYFFGAGRQTAALKPAVEFRRVVPYPSQIVHVPMPTNWVPANAGTHGSANSRVDKWVSAFAGT